MSRYTQDNKELLGHLKEQIAFMQESAISYDRGFESEAKRLAVVIRVLVHDTSQSTSLLTLLGRKRQMLFYDSASKYDPRNLATSNCLTMMKLSTTEGAEYVAPLDDLSLARDKNKKRSFDNWWERLIIYKDNRNNTFTRKKLVLAVANKEGGAHVNPRLDQAYADLSRFNSLGWKQFVHGEEKDFNNTPILPSIRQIAHEVLRTLRDEFPDLF
jgi:hypothetical protein